jgi:surfactin synthase thioesterase subunit
MLWGHSSGAALALATARRLEHDGVEVERVFVGAQLLRDAAGRNADIKSLRVKNDAEIASGLRADGGYTELGDLDRSHALQVGAAYRHDCLAAHRYFVEQLDDPPAVKLAAPLTVVVAADDPVTIEWPGRSADWQLLADHVDAFELADGGHYFLRTRPTEAAEAVLRASRPLNLQR